MVRQEGGEGLSRQFQVAAEFLKRTEKTTQSVRREKTTKKALLGRGRKMLPDRRWAIYEFDLSGGWGDEAHTLLESKKRLFSENEEALLLHGRTSHEYAGLASGERRNLRSNCSEGRDVSRSLPGA